MSGPSSRLLAGLRVLVLLRFALHALFLPVYEGPDEPFHLGRARLVADRPLTEAIRGESVDRDLVRSMRSRPCGPPMHAAFGCPSFGGAPAAFDILSSHPPPGAAEEDGRQENYQAHQPPLYYLAAGLLLKLFALGAAGAPANQLLLLRLASVLLVGVALFLPVRKLGKGNALFQATLLLGLLLPGAAESLVRVANDVAVFAWSAVLVWIVFRSGNFKPGLTAFLAGLGPMLKLTALPVVAVAAVVGWRRRGWRSGLVIAASGLVVLPLQWLRGWAWGGTLEANTASPTAESISTVLLGLAHSSYTFVKTAIWLGGWSSFRPPAALAVAVPLFVAWLAVRVFRLRPRLEHWPAHAAGLAVALLGFIAFAIGKQALFGVWGAVGGWYAWGWAPWLALLAAGTLELRDGRGREAILGALAGALLLNLAWFDVALRTYG